MDKSLTELKQLAEYTTPGPWTADNKPEKHVAYIRGKHGKIIPPHARTLEGDANITLMALAPELLAEVIRMREELVAMRDHARGDYEAGDMSPDGNQYAFDLCTNLTRILGDEK